MSSQISYISELNFEEGAINYTYEEMDTLLSSLEFFMEEFKNYEIEKRHNFNSKKVENLIKKTKRRMKYLRKLSE